MARTKLLYSHDDYTPRQLGMKDPREVRKEYQRLRSIASKRLRRLEEADLIDSDVYRYNKAAYPASSTLTDAELRYHLSKLSDFIVSPATTVSGVKAQYDDMLNTLHDRGFDGINRTNIAEFGRFMEAYRASNLDKIYDSKRVAKIFSESAKGNAAGRGNIRATQRLMKAFNSYLQDQRA